VETLPLEPLKLSAVVESLMLLGVELAQMGVAMSIAARGRRIFLFTTRTPGDGMRDARLTRGCTAGLKRAIQAVAKIRMRKIDNMLS
jgi:hypothetical protein